MKFYYNTKPTVKTQRSQKGCKYQRETKIRPTKVSPGICLGSLNIDGQKNKIPELGKILQQRLIGPGIKVPDILAVSETHELDADEYKLKNHFWFGKPSPPTGNIGHAGVGFWVSKTLRLACTTAPDFLTPHKDILWLQLITNGATYYIASLYSRPGRENLDNHKSILETLKENLIQLRGLGLCIIMGDFNSDPRKTNSTNLEHTQEFAHFLKATGYISLVPQSQSYEVPPSFVGTQGSSNPDHILIPKQFQMQIEHFEIHQNISAGADHRMLSTSFAASMYEDLGWGSPDILAANWSEENISTFQDTLFPLLSPITNELRQAKTRNIRLADKAAGALNLALNASLQTIQHKINTPVPGMGEENHVGPQIDALIKKRNRLSKVASHYAHREWKTINALQAEIVQLVKQEIAKKDSIWWKKIMSVDLKANPKKFWKIAEKLKKSTGSPFPGFMTDDQEKIITGRPEILLYISQYYECISEACDEEALDFYEKYMLDSNDINNERKKDISSLESKVRFSAASPNEQLPLVHDLPFTQPEIHKGIWKSKNGKAPGFDKITTECLKNGGRETEEALVLLFNLLHELGHTPAEWQRANTILLHKGKGLSAAKIKNYRPITLLNTVFKIWERVLETRLRATMELRGLISPNQFGSRKNMDTKQSLFITQYLINWSSDNGKKLYLAHMDLSKAYNRVNRARLWNLLHKNGLQGKLWNSLRSTYSHQSEQITIGTHSSIPYHLTNGLRQGSVLSPLLFILYANPLIEALNATGAGIMLPGLRTKLSCLMFVDDLQLIATSLCELSVLIQALTEHAARWDFIINSGKTHILTNDKSQLVKAWCVDNGLPKEPSTKNVFLGAVTMPSSRSGSAHVAARISKGHATAHFMESKGLYAGGLCLPVCIFIFNTVIVSSLLYGMETMQISDAEFNNLDYFMACILAKILHNGPVIGPPQWTLWEAGCLPAKILVSISAHRLLRKMSLVSPLKSTTANLMLGEGPASAFFWKYMDQMEPFYPPTFQGLHMKANSPSKRYLNESLTTASEAWFAYLIENTPAANMGTTIKEDLAIQSHILLAPQPDRMIILKARAKHIFLMAADVPVCNLCNTRAPATLVHLLSQCNFPPIQAINKEVTMMLQDLNKDLRDSWVSLTPQQKTNIFLGTDWNSPLEPKIKLIKLAANLLRVITAFPTVLVL